MAVYRAEALIIDNCHMTDESFALILEGVLAQAERSGGYPHLKKLVYIGNYLGPISLALLDEVMGGLTELTIAWPSRELSRLQITELLRLVRHEGLRM